jgi:hypothetical protein
MFPTYTVTACVSGRCPRLLGFLRSEQKLETKYPDSVKFTLGSKKSVIPWHESAEHLPPHLLRSGLQSPFPDPLGHPLGNGSRV